MAGISTGAALLYSALISAAATGASAYAQHEDATAAAWDQKQAQNKAEQAQKTADEKAERKRLEGLVTNQSATDYGNVWGVGSAKYKDAAQKLSAGVGSFNTEDEDDNPFYSRGLI